MTPLEHGDSKEYATKLSKEKLLNLALIIAGVFSAAYEKSSAIPSAALEELKTQNQTVEQLRPEQTEQMVRTIEAFKQYVDHGGNPTVTIEHKNAWTKEAVFLDHNAILITEPDEQTLYQLIREGKFQKDMLVIKKGAISEFDDNHGIDTEVGVDVKTNLIMYVQNYIKQSEEKGFHITLDDGSKVKLVHGAAYDAGYGQEVATGAAQILGELSRKLAEKGLGK